MSRQIFALTVYASTAFYRDPSGLGFDDDQLSGSLCAFGVVFGVCVVPSRAQALYVTRLRFWPAEASANATKLHLETCKKASRIQKLIYCDSTALHHLCCSRAASPRAPARRQLALGQLRLSSEAVPHKPIGTLADPHAERHRLSLFRSPQANLTQAHPSPTRRHNDPATAPNPPECARYNAQSPARPFRVAPGRRDCQRHDRR